jgi:hypothetical protein
MKKDKIERFVKKFSLQITPSVQGGVVNEPLYLQKSRKLFSVSINRIKFATNCICVPSRISTMALSTYEPHALCGRSVDMTMKNANTAICFVLTLVNTKCASPAPCNPLIVCSEPSDGELPLKKEAIYVT